MASDESASDSDSEDGLFYHKGPVNAEWSDEEPKNAFAAGQNLSDSSDDDENDDDDGLMLSQRHARTRMKKRGRDSCTATPPPKTSEETPTSAEKRRAATVGSARALASADNMTASTSRAAASSRASALLSAVDELARPPSPVFLSPTVAAVEEEDNEDSDSDGVREFGLEDRSDDDNDDDSDSRDPLDDFDEGELITIQFQLPTGKKYARKVGIKSTFTSIMCNWKASDDWDIVASALGSPNVVLFFDGESISANATPEDLDLEDDDTVDVAVGKKAAKAW